VYIIKRVMFPGVCLVLISFEVSVVSLLNYSRSPWTPTRSMHDGR